MPRTRHHANLTASAWKALPIPTPSACCRSPMTASSCGWPIWSWPRHSPTAAPWSCCYWAPVIKTLSEPGYRVVVPDQIGFGKSSKPISDLHFDTLARNTIALLDHLQITKADIVAHSLGGMLGVRIARAY